MEHIRTVTRDFQTGEKAVLHVEARSGAVQVEAHAGNHVLVEAVIHIWTDRDEDVDDAELLVSRGMEQNEHRVIVRAPSLPQAEGWSFWNGRRGSRIDYMIRVPAITPVRVLSKSGQVRVAGTEGRVHIETGSGRTGVERINGPVEIVSRSGSISVEDVIGDLEAEARSGRIDVRGITGCAQLTARSGSIEARDITADLRVRAHTGSVVIENAHARVSAEAHTGAVRYRGRVEGDIEMKAHTGLIHLAVDPDYPFFLDAQSDLGSVRSDLPPRRGGGPPSNGGHKVRLRTHTGAIRLSRL